jgi:hypothetical protein
MQATLNTLPNGALITQVAFYVRDDDPGTNFQGALCPRLCRLLGTAQGTGTGCEPSIDSAGQPGETIVFANYNPPIPIFYRRVNGDGSADVVNHFLNVQLLTPDIAIRTVRIRWKRQVSPPPGTATFNDVPTGHIFFQFVEALAACGITAGCGSGNYCPDAPLTRGQMAVFLSKALGPALALERADALGLERLQQRRRDALDLVVSSSANIGSASTSRAARSASGKSPSRPPRSAKHSWRCSGTG